MTKADEVVASKLLAETYEAISSRVCLKRLGIMDDGFCSGECEFAM